ncbi:LuxR C-terminal-related transcriptional regulator [Nocardioides sp.]|uniref:helix-turn-helix transcriptional regulator n=1 Tax=Nocardioides sp. TaxID=35761 RepID=UPI00261EEF13|nr:LuxR C-terminal-related transcriptional regulator [Nocardioides sp.]
MAPRSNETLLTALGFSRATGRLYERLLIQDGLAVAKVAAAMDLEPATLAERMAPLVQAEIVAVERGRLQVRRPAQVVSAMLQRASDEADEAQRRIGEIAQVLPLLAEPGQPGQGGAETLDVGDPIDGEIVVNEDRAEQIRTLTRSSGGDLLWLRPDQWREGWEGEMSGVVSDLLASGRRVRAIYPVRVLTDAPEVPRLRAEMGEEIRLLAELPTRMVVVGTSHVLLPEPLGYTASPRSVIRQRGVVELAVLLFEQLWAQATPLPGVQSTGRDDLRRFLVAELAAGSQDEQIARRLGLSLRTVRRRVAELMEELGASSRFQAGVEAARRGWL